MIDEDHTAKIKEYELLSGEKVDLSLLPTEDCEHISKIEKLIEVSADYFEVYRQAPAPLLDGKSFNARSLSALYSSPQYRVLEDLVGRYHKKCFG